MPELGDVEGFRRQALALSDATVTALDITDPEVLRNIDPAGLRSALMGGVIGPATRHGKWLTLPVGDVSLVFHFGMTGSLSIGRSDLSAPPFTRLVLVAGADEAQLQNHQLRLQYVDRRRLGGIHMARSDDEHAAIVGPIGPDALNLAPGELRDRLGSARHSIKAAMVDQQRIAGIGNFGADEILWRARVRPDAAAKFLSEADWIELERSLRATLRATARAGHTPRGPSWLTGSRFDAEGRCPRCATLLERIVIAGRTSVLCPRCQPAEESSPA